MRILLPGNKNKEDGFIMLRDMIVMFIVIICFAAVIAALATVSRQGSKLFENTQKELEERNDFVLKRINK